MSREEFIDTETALSCALRQEGRGGASGVPVEATFWFVYGVRDDKIVTWDMYAST